MTPAWPDPDMDPVSAIIMNKKTMLPAGSISHLTLVFYFDDCPELERVKDDAKALLDYDRFCSVHVPNERAIFESAWSRVEVKYDELFGERKVAGKEEFDKVLDEMALQPFNPPKDAPLWRMDILRNSKGTSAVVWRLCHSIGDGIGLLPIGYKFARTMDGKAARPDIFRPKRGSRKKGKKGLWPLVESALKDLHTIATLSRGAFDNCESINQNYKNDKLIHNGKRVRVGFDFKLDDIKVIKRATGFTINDILVAIFAGGVRRYMAEMKDPALKTPEKAKMTGLAPFAQPRANTPGKVQNNMVFVHFRFPVGPETLIERLQQAHKEFDHLKRSIQVPALKLITELGTKLGLEQALLAENNKIWHRTSWVFSNVPGPKETMVVFGKEMTSLKPFYCNVLHQAIFFSYAGSVSLALVVDTESIKDPKLLVQCIVKELKEAQKVNS
eukprot:CAMPEP_0167762194 /NCGR_PEP_ID=MMETSP0110_2-20121227/12614_1 /TAXON_ID=629695 /ORGANISM="Gymnochlora sp., Strain CCMP2014" /LENGTH=442 /DNA_ID=CAMNT_0007649005 /DNA_START=104 /DNA_END=1432 /DNA_ORIENTATION=-